MQKIEPFEYGSTMQQFQASNLSEFYPPIPKKSKEKEQCKQNQSKHLNAIKPYIAGNANSKQRKVSKRESQKHIPHFSPYLNQNNPSINNSGNFDTITKSKGKKSDKNDSGIKKLEESGIGGKNVGELYTELITIKSEYKTLKNSYTGLVKQNSELTERGDKQVSNLRRQMEKLRRQQEKQREQSQFVCEQMERIKKECIKMIQIEKNRNKKLEETIQQKQLMIAYLRSQLSIFNQQNNLVNGFYFQHTAPTYIKNHAPTFSFIPSNRQSQLDVQARNLSMACNIPQSLNFSKIKNSKAEIPNLINQSVISSIENMSAYGTGQGVDLAISGSYNNPMNSKNVNNEKNMINKINSGHGIIANRRQYIFSNEDDSLSFSYQRQKSSIVQQSKHTAQQSVFSQDDPSVLTFTKKDVYILDEDNFESDSDVSKNHNGKYNAEQILSYTGQEEIMTFENRFGKTNKCYKDLEKPKVYKNGELKGKQNSKWTQMNPGKYKNKSKENTKRLDIFTDEVSLREPKQQSSEPNKRPTTYGPSNSKRGKKKLSRKRGSQENGNFLTKK